MKFLQIIIHICVLFSFYLIGEWIRSLFNLLIPGSIIGLLLLFIMLSLNMYPIKWVEAGAQFMMRHLIIFFIPSTVGLMGYFGLFAGKGIFLVIITLVSSVAVMVCAAKVSEWLWRGEGNE